MADEVEYGERLKERRGAAGLTQGQVSVYEDVSTSYLSNLERGHNVPSVWDLLARLAKRYHTSTDYLLGLTDDPSPREPQTMGERHVVYEVESVGTHQRVQELLATFTQLGDRRQEELIRLGETLLAVQIEEEEALTAEMRALLDALEAQLSPEMLDQLYDLLEMTSGLAARPEEAHLGEDEAE